MVVFDFRASPTLLRTDQLGPMARHAKAVTIIAAPFALHPPITARDALDRQVWRAIDRALEARDPRWRAPSAAQDLLIGEALIDQETAIVPPLNSLAALLLIEVWQRRFGFRPWIIALWDQHAPCWIDLDAHANEWS